MAISGNARIAIWVAVVCVALGFLWLVRSVLPPFVAAIIIAIVLEPLVEKLCATGLPRPVAVGTITLGFFALFALVIIALAPKISDQINEARTNVQAQVDQWSVDEANDNVFVRWNPVVRSQPPGPMAVVDRTIEQLQPTLSQFGLPSSRRALVEEYITPHRNEIATSVQTFLKGFVGSLGGAIATIFPMFFTPIFVVAILMDAVQMRSRAKEFIPPALRNGTVDVVHDIMQVLQRYLQGMLINISLYFLVMSIILTALGVPYSVLLALMAAILYLIPIIGGWISGISITTVAALSGSTGPGFLHLPSPIVYTAIVFVTFLLTSATWDILITPKVVGSAVNLHPLLAMFVVFCGGGLFGLLGMVIAYPIAGIVKVALARIMAVANDPNVAELNLPVVPPRHRISSA